MLLNHLRDPLDLGNGDTILHLTESPRCVQVTLARTTDIDPASADHSIPRAVQYLVNKWRMDVDVRNGRGWTPLHTAAHTGRTAVAQELLQLGADPWLANPEGRRARSLCPGDRPDLVRAIEVSALCPPGGRASLLTHVAGMGRGVSDAGGREGVCGHEWRVGGHARGVAGS
jgi:hypothetical protein